VIDKRRSSTARWTSPRGRLSVALAALTWPSTSATCRTRRAALSSTTFPLVQAGSEVSTCWPHAFGGGLPADAGRRDGRAAERITSTQGKSITSLQACTSRDDYTDPAPFTTFTHSTPRPSCHGRSRRWVSTCRRPAGVDVEHPGPEIVGERHYAWPVACRRSPALQGAAGHHRHSGHGTSCPRGPGDRDRRAAKIQRFSRSPSSSPRSSPAFGDLRAHRRDGGVVRGTGHGELGQRPRAGVLDWVAWSPCWPRPRRCRTGRLVADDVLRRGSCDSRAVARGGGATSVVFGDVGRRAHGARRSHPIGRRCRARLVKVDLADGTHVHLACTRLRPGGHEPGCGRGSGRRRWSAPRALDPGDVLAGIAELSQEIACRAERAARWLRNGWPSLVRDGPRPPSSPAAMRPISPCARLKELGPAELRLLVAAPTSSRRSRKPAAGRRARQTKADSDERDGAESDSFASA